MSFIIYSCKNEIKENNQTDSNNNNQSKNTEATNIDASKVKYPEKEQIMNDLLGKSVNDWTFKKLDEFDGVDIINTRIINTNILELTIDLDLTDYFKHDNWDGQVIINYELLKDNQWHFVNVSGNLINNDKDNKTPRITRTIGDQN